MELLGRRAAAVQTGTLATLGPPGPPSLVEDPSGGWVIVPANAAHVAFTGGRLATDVAQPDAPLRFTAAPRRVVVWDHLGRATVQDFSPDGAPVATPPLRPDPDAPDAPQPVPGAAR